MNIQLFPFISETLIGAILLLATIILYNNRHWPEETPVRSYSAYAVLCLLSFYYSALLGSRILVLACFSALDTDYACKRRRLDSCFYFVADFFRYIYGG